MLKWRIEWKICDKLKQTKNERAKKQHKVIKTDTK